MLNTKLNLYNAEWLDVVFAERNKAYGAYNLRQHYSGTMIKAMTIAFSVILAASIAVNVIARNRVEPMVGTVVELDPDIIQPPKLEQPKKVEPPKEQAPIKPQAPVATKKFTTMVVTDGPVIEEPPVIDELTGVIGSENKKGADPGPDVNALPVENTGSGTGTTVAPPSNEPVNAGTLEVQPEPFGGMDAFGKFLGKTLRYPTMASEAGIQGRVVVSFVIERDGSLTNIVVEKGIGYGCDQEAIRVLKLAKAWKPGIQNGQPVRVRYMIPISFQLPE
jgi:protein TonB